MSSVPSWFIPIERQYEGRSCARLLGFFRHVKNTYEESIGLPFSTFWSGVSIKSGGSFLSVAAELIAHESGWDLKAHRPIPSRHWYDMDISDIYAFGSCLKYSLMDHYLMIHYADNITYHNSCFSGEEDVWSIYDGILKECRSAVIDLDTMEFASLPFSKFMNMRENEEYSEENIRRRIASARPGQVEFADKMDGSFIQMRYVGNGELYGGFLISTSGSLHKETAPQIADAEQYLCKHPGIRKLISDFPLQTFIFEWISPADPHIVQYSPSDTGLHLISTRNVQTGRLMPYSFTQDLAKRYFVPYITIYPGATLDNIMSTLTSYKAAEKEGYVLYIDEFLVKIKCADFIGAMKNIVLSKSFPHVLECFIEGTVDDLISNLPGTFKTETLAYVDKISRFLSVMAKIIETEYAQLPTTLDKKGIMIYINNIHDPYNIIRENVRAKYLGHPVHILYSMRGEFKKLIKESTVDKCLAIYEKKEGAISK